MASEKPTVAGRLATFLVETRIEDLADLALERARMIIASTIASAAMGRGIASSRIIREMVRECGGVEDASIWFEAGPRLPVADVARANAVMSDAAASDDSDMRAIAHIGTIVSTTAIAMGERLGASGRDVLGAMVLGYEAAGRIDEALVPGRGQKGFHGSVSTVFGGTVACGRLLGLTVEQMEHAISLAATSIGGLAISADTSVAREYHAGLSALLGVNAAVAAKKGFTAETTILEAPRGFFSAFGTLDHVSDVTKDLGNEWDIVTDMAIKLFPGAHPNHAAAEAAAVAAVNGDVDPADVVSIRISQPNLLALAGPRHPTDLVGVAHSIAYMVAGAVADRGYRWIHATPAKVSDPVISRLIDTIELDETSAALPSRFPYRHGATVTIRLNDGREFTEHVEQPRGSGFRGIDWSDVDEKYRTLAPLSGMSSQRLEAALRLVHDFDQVQRMSDLTALLCEDIGRQPE